MSYVSRGIMTTGNLDKPAYLFCGSLIDGSGKPVLERVLITINGGIIAAINSGSSKTTLPPDAADLSDFTILPGLIDCHVHLFMSGTADLTMRERQLNYTFDEAGPVISHHLDDQLRHGVVAVRDGGDYGGHALHFKKELMPGSNSPLTMQCAGRAWHAQGRYGRLIGRPPNHGKTLAQSIAASDEKPDHIKIVNSGINSLTEFGRETLPQFNHDEMTNAVIAAQQLGLKTMVHANGCLPVRIAALAGCHSVEHGFFMGDENLRLLADRQICWIPTACTMKAYAEQTETGTREAGIALRNLDHQLGQMRLARQLGVPMAIGTDCGSLGVHHGASFSEEMKLFMDAGFTIPEVVSCATSRGAELLGIDREIGVLKVGMQATFVAVKGSPSAMPGLLTRELRVFHKGKSIQCKEG
jgi:imidazolonepropionase-like amidohydrolase